MTPPKFFRRRLASGRSLCFIVVVDHSDSVYERDNEHDYTTSNVGCKGANIMRYPAPGIRGP